MNTIPVVFLDENNQSRDVNALSKTTSIQETNNDEIENKYRFDETAVYSCKTLDRGKPPESYWEEN